ncbi:MAG TPA: amidohydrolase family protein [Gemmatimonadales bacterium]|nr:amidohydrolase family protein [Gemmatimonadales bacterium]
MPARRLAARWVVPVAAPPIEGGAVLLGSDGRIEAIGPDALVPRPAGVPGEAFPDAILIPGLVNAHTHLELTGFDLGAAPETDFRSWVARVRAVKETRSADDFVAWARLGIAESWSGGVTTVGDTGDSGSVIQALAELGGSGVAYQEVFGPHPSQVRESLAGLQGRVEEVGRWAGGRVRIGVSPHAPYTVSGPLYAAVATWARVESLPLAVHLAESPAESELLLRGTGPFADAWHERGIPLPPGPRCSPVEWVERHGVLGERTLCIHVVQAHEADLTRLARSAAAVAHCPLSNAAHRHGEAPLGGFLACGIRVGLGTDSVLSVGTPDLLAEARAARRLADLDADAALTLATLGGARALGLEGEIGSLEPGKWGDCAVVRPRSPAGGPAEQVIGARREDVVATFLGGRDVYRAEPVRA